MAIATVTMAMAVAAMTMPSVEGTVRSCFRKTVKKFDVLDHVLPRVTKAADIINLSYYWLSLTGTLQQRTKKRYAKRTPQNATTPPPHPNIKLNETYNIDLYDVVGKLWKDKRKRLVITKRLVQKYLLR